MKLGNPLDNASNQGDEQVTLFPSLVYYDLRREVWRAIVQGRMCDVSRVPMGTRLMIKGLKRALKASDEELASEIFRERIQGFAATPISGRRIAVDIAGHFFPLKRRSKSNGTFLGVCSLPRHSLPSPYDLDRSRIEPLRAKVVSAGNAQPPELETLIHVVPPRGISVISDIDDTIKATNVVSRQSMLTNTFLRPFTAIAGMAELYREWNTRGAEFHYVSSSPWQLFQPLAELCELSKFPAGSMHLRYFRIRDEMFKRWRPGRRKGKAAIIAGLMKKLPQRQFVLVGDSGERDAEIYHFLAKKFPSQVKAILIRQLDSRPLDDRRMQRMNELHASTVVHLYRDAEELRYLTRNLL